MEFSWGDEDEWESGRWENCGCYVKWKNELLNKII